MKVVGKTFYLNISALSTYLPTWRLKLAYAKTVTVAYHQYNQETKLEIKVYNTNEILPFCSVPIYLGVKLDRTSDGIQGVRTGSCEPDRGMSG